MAYLGRKGASAALNSADIPDNSITGAKIVAGTIEASDVAADMATQAELEAQRTDSSITTLGTVTAGTYNATIGSTATFPAGHIISYKIEVLDGTEKSTASTTYVETHSDLRITHALSDASNKLVFSVNSPNMYIMASLFGTVDVAKTTDTTTGLLTRPLIYLKHHGNVEKNGGFGFAEYLPGVTTEFTYTVIYKSTGSSFYFANAAPTCSIRFSLMEVVV